MNWWNAKNGSKLLLIARKRKTSKIDQWNFVKNSGLSLSTEVICIFTEQIFWNEKRLHIYKVEIAQGSCCESLEIFHVKYCIWTHEKSIFHATFYEKKSFLLLLLAVKVDESFQITEMFGAMRYLEATPEIGTRCTVIGMGLTIKGKDEIFICVHSMFQFLTAKRQQPFHAIHLIKKETTNATISIWFTWSSNLIFLWRGSWTNFVQIVENQRGSGRYQLL